MAGDNQFYPHATGAGANVLSNTALAALNARQVGFAAGIARSVDVNSVLRQGAVMASMIGDFISVHNFDALDDGDLETLRENFEAALADLIGANLPGQAAYWHYGIDTGSTATSIVANVSPDIASYALGSVYAIKAAHDSANGGTNANLDSRGTKPVKKLGSSAIQIGDWQAGQIVVLVDDGTSLQLINVVTTVPSIGQSHYGLASGSASAITVATLTPPLTIPYERGTTAMVEMPSGFGIGAGATIKLATGAIVDLLRNDGSDVADGDGPAGSPVFIFCDGSNWRLVGPGRAEYQRVAVNPILRIAPTGNDTTGDGSSGNPFRQPKKALAVGLSRYNFAASVLTIIAVDGDYEAPEAIPRGSGQVQFVGNALTPGNCVITGSSSSYDALTLVRGDCSFNGFTFRNTGTSAHTFANVAGANTILQNCKFETTVAGNAGAHIFAGGTVVIAAGCSFDGDMGILVSVAGGPARCAINTSTTVDVLGTPDFSVATVVARSAGQFVIPMGAGFSGLATGVKALIRDGIVDVNGAGINAIPGDQPYVIVSGGNGVYRP